MPRVFNKILFEIGDKVHSRNTDNRVIGIVDREKMVTNEDDLQYQIIWVGGSVWSAYDFEPTDPIDRAAYIAAYKQHGIKAIRIKGKVTKAPVIKKGGGFNLKKHKDDKNRETE